MPQQFLRKAYRDESNVLTASRTYPNGVSYFLLVHIDDAMHQEGVKDTVVNALMPYLDDMSYQTIDTQDIENLLVAALQECNNALIMYSQKNRSDTVIAIQGGLTILYRGMMRLSLIGDASTLVCRGHKPLYTMNNTDRDVSSEIDVFMDYIDGPIHAGDTIMLLGCDYSLFFHPRDIQDIAGLLALGGEGMIPSIDACIADKTDPSRIRFVTVLSGMSQTLAVLSPSSLRGARLYTATANRSTRVWHFLQLHRYWVGVGCIVVFVLLSLYGLLAQSISQQLNVPTVITDKGPQQIYIADVKKDIETFVTLDPSSSETSTIYTSIMQRLLYLEKQGKWIDDVTQLKKIVAQQYYKTFHIIYISSLDSQVSTAKMQYAFTSNESTLLGKPLRLLYNQGLYIAGTKGAILKGVNNDVRGTTMAFSIQPLIKDCNFDLSRAGLYCYDDMNELYHVTAGNMNALTVAENTTFPTAIRGLHVFAKSKLYMLIDPAQNGGKDSIKTYRNQLGSMTQFVGGPGIAISSSTGSETLDFSSLTIDGTLLVWSPSHKQIYQLWRDGKAETYNKRAISMLGGDNTMQGGYGPNVKIIAHATTNYVYLFDSTKQTVTMYQSQGAKTNPGSTTNYSLSYVMRYMFDDATNPVLDVTVAEDSGTKPILSVLTAKGVYSINIYNDSQGFAGTLTQ